MKIIQWAAAILFICLFALNCSNNPTNPEPIPTGHVTGYLTSMMGVSPVLDETVYLFDKLARVDSVNYDNRHFFIDSTTTDSTGYYELKDIKPGEYAVFPKHITRFDHESSRDAFEFSIEGGEDYDIRFQEHFQSQFGFFEVLFRLINIPEGQEDKYKYAFVYRRDWIFFVPYWAFNFSREPFHSEGNSLAIQFSTDYGHTIAVNTLDNYFKFEFYSNVSDFHKTPSLELEFGTPISATPEYMEWTYDCTTGELKRIP